MSAAAAANGAARISAKAATVRLILVVKGSITVAPTNASQTNASVLTFGGTNRSGFFNSLSMSENAAVDSSTGYKTAVYLDASYAGANLELAEQIWTAALIIGR